MCEGWKDAGTRKCDNTSINSVCVCSRDSFLRVVVLGSLHHHTHHSDQLYVSHMQVKLVSNQSRAVDDSCENAANGLYNDVKETLNYQSCIVLV